MKRLMEPEHDSSMPSLAAAVWLAVLVFVVVLGLAMVAR